MIKGNKRLNKDAEEKEKQSMKEFAATVPLYASYMNASLLEPFAKPITTEIALLSLVVTLDKNIEEIKSGNMSSLEAMLISQAQALQTIFVSLGMKASSQSQLKHYTAFMTLALKAQSQSRATIQALVELKYPKQIAFVKQANIAHGHQQVNNGTVAQSAAISGEQARAEKIINQPNELLEVNHGSKEMDGRATQTAIPKDKAMATVAT